MNTVCFCICFTLIVSGPFQHPSTEPVAPFACLSSAKTMTAMSLGMVASAWRSRNSTSRIMYTYHHCSLMTIELILLCPRYSCCIAFASSAITMMGTVLRLSCLSAAIAEFDMSGQEFVQPVLVYEDQIYFTPDWLYLLLRLFLFGKKSHFFSRTLFSPRREL